MQFKMRILENMNEKSIMENLMVKEHTLVLMDKNILVNGRKENGMVKEQKLYMMERNM